MSRFLTAFAVAALAAAPAMAQKAPEKPAETETKTVKKTVCQPIEPERTTGSRLGSTTKVCKTVEVPATEKDKKAQSTQPQGHSAHAH